MIEKTEKELLVELDAFEEEIRLLNVLNKKYDDIKKDIKKAMIKLGKENNLEQVKWITPNGTKITCTIGRPAEVEIQNTKEFNIDILKEKYPNIYMDCLEEKEVHVITKNATNDALRITLKEGVNKK